MNRLQFVALTMADGSLGVLQFNLEPRLPDGCVPPGYDPETGRREPTDEAIEYEISRACHSVTSWRRISPEDLPPARTYRNAWRDTGERIEHDMPKAREIHRAILRRQRAPLLAELDVDYQRADERGDAKGKRAIGQAKQRLRDITADPRIEAAQTVEQLRTITLD